MKMTAFVFAAPASASSITAARIDDDNDKEHDREGSNMDIDGDDCDVDNAPPNTTSDGSNRNYSLVTPGQTITQDALFMRGHGTYQVDDATNAPIKHYAAGATSATTTNPTSGTTDATPAASTTLVSSVFGTVNRINRLLSVQPLHARYGGEIGDVVVGRITEITQKRWKVDICSRQVGEYSH